MHRRGKLRHMPRSQNNALRLVKGFLLRVLALVGGSGCPTQTHPDPFVSIGKFWFRKRSDIILVSSSISDIHWAYAASSP